MWYADFVRYLMRGTGRLAVVLGIIGIACSTRDPGTSLDFQIMGDSYKHRRGEPLPAESAIFDGQRVTLRGVRGETLGMQVLVREPEGHELAIELELAAPGVSVQPFQMDWIQVARASTSMYGPSRGTGWYADRLGQGRVLRCDHCQ